MPQKQNGGSKLGVIVEEMHTLSIYASAKHPVIFDLLQSLVLCCPHLKAKERLQLLGCRIRRTFLNLDARHIRVYEGAF